MINQALPIIEKCLISLIHILLHTAFIENFCVSFVTANQTSGQKNEPRSTTAQIPYSVHHNELQ